MQFAVSKTEQNFIDVLRLNDTDNQNGTLFLF